MQIETIDHPVSAVIGLAAAVAIISCLFVFALALSVPARRRRTGFWLACSIAAALACSCVAAMLVSDHRRQQQIEASAAAQLEQVRAHYEIPDLTVAASDSTLCSASRTGGDAAHLPARWDGGTRRGVLTSMRHDGGCVISLTADAPGPLVQTP